MYAEYEEKLFTIIRKNEQCIISAVESVSLNKPRIYLKSKEHNKGLGAKVCVP
jgi:hypothetical protein